MCYQYLFYAKQTNNCLDVFYYIIFIDVDGVLRIERDGLMQLKPDRDGTWQLKLPHHRLQSEKNYYPFYQFRSLEKNSTAECKTDQFK